MEPTFEELLISRLDKLESKLDAVRTLDIPTIKTDMAILVNENKHQSKLHSFIGSIIAIGVSALLPHR